MPDQILICQNCSSEFIFPEGEQNFYKEKGLETPKLCPICRSIKKQQSLIPPKPKEEPKVSS